MVSCNKLVTRWFLFMKLVVCWLLFMKHVARWFLYLWNLYSKFFPRETNFTLGNSCVLKFCSWNMFRDAFCSQNLSHVNFSPRQADSIHGTCCVLIFVRTNFCVLIFLIVKLVHCFSPREIVLFMELVACWFFFLILVDLFFRETDFLRGTPRVLIFSYSWNLLHPHFCWWNFLHFRFSLCKACTLIFLLVKLNFFHGIYCILIFFVRRTC